MASSKLLKEAIADAKAVRETAIANAKIALEEAFTPRLQSILSRKLQAEMEDTDDEDLDDVNEENDVSTEIGKSDNKLPAAKSNTAQTDLSGISKTGAAEGSELDDYDKVSGLTEGDDDLDGDVDLDTDDDTDLDTDGDVGGDEDWNTDDTDGDQDEDDLDLESIIRELEAGLEGDGESDEYSDDTDVDEADENEDGVTDDVTGATNPYTEGDEDGNTEWSADDATGEDDEIDLDEILREMGYGDDEEDDTDAPVDDDSAEELAATQTELKEAIKTIHSLRKTINEVNLLNAKLLFANKLFRGYNLTNEQKIKVVENLDRTSTVREVKLVYSTLCESMKFSGTQKKQSVKRTISEGLASKPQKSTAPKKEILSEGAMMATRFQELAGIIKK